jgi:hypothetical protein
MRSLVVTQTGFSGYVQVRAVCIHKLVLLCATVHDEGQTGSAQM